MSMSISFARFASQYYNYSRKTQGRKLDWHQAQAEASSLYESYKTNYTGDLHAEPCDRWFEDKTDSDTCVRTVGKSRSSYDTKNNEQWSRVLEKRTHLLNREQERTQQMSEDFRQQREILDARIRELSDLVSEKDVELQTALRAESASWSAHDHELQEIQNLLKKAHQEAEAKSVEQEQLVQHEHEHEEDIFKSEMKKLDSEAQEQLVVQRIANQDLQRQLSDAKDQMFQTEDRRQILHADLLELQEAQQQGQTDLQEMRTQWEATRTELLKHTKASSQEAQKLGAQIKTLKLQLTDSEQQVATDKSQRNSAKDDQLLMQSQLLLKKDNDIARLTDLLEETRALLSDSRNQSANHNVIISNLQQEKVILIDGLRDANESAKMFKNMQRRDNERARGLQQRLDALSKPIL